MTDHVPGKENFGTLNGGLNVPLSVPLNVPLNVPLTSREQKILEMILKNRTITAFEISEQLSVTEKTIKRDISGLKERNVLAREGGRKIGYWVVKSTES